MKDYPAYFDPDGFLIRHAFDGKARRSTSASEAREM
jgi:hypothetical protein